MIRESELILNPDQSIYHLHLQPEHLADTIITVGDPNRVAAVSKHFDEMEFQLSKREFVTHTGRIGNKRLSVISTGIGPDNIDIVFNELDALFNVDFETRTVKEDLQALKFIRLGTSGSLQAHIPVDSFLISTHAIGLDNLMSFYDFPQSDSQQAWRHSLKTAVPALPGQPHIFKAPGSLAGLFPTNFFRGITLTCPGFYAPQGRQIRLASKITSAVFDQMRLFQIEGKEITNMEMETAAMYGMAGLLGHEAISCNAILANRVDRTFSTNPTAVVAQMIEEVLELLVGG